MEKEKAVSLAKEIIELDMKRDEMLEAFMQLAGEHAFSAAQSRPERTLPKNIIIYRSFTMALYVFDIKALF